MESISDVCVLFVDDELDVLSSMRRFLRNEPYQMEFADSGKKALTIMAARPVAMIVSDLRMPEMDGLTLLKKVKADFPETKRLILSATQELGPVIHAVDDGDVFRFIQKPLDPDSFRQIIRDAAAVCLVGKKVLSMPESDGKLVPGSS